MELGFAFGVSFSSAALSGDTELLIYGSPWLKSDDELFAVETPCVLAPLVTILSSSFIPATGGVSWSIAVSGIDAGSLAVVNCCSEDCVSRIACCACSLASAVSRSSIC